MVLLYWVELPSFPSLYIWYVCAVMTFITIRVEVECAFNVKALCEVSDFVTVV